MPKSSKTFESDFVEGAEFIILHAEDWFAMSYKEGQSYKMMGRDTLSKYGDTDGERTLILKGQGPFTYASGDTEAWRWRAWHSTDSQIAIFPVARLTDVELFTIKIAGPEAIFGKREDAKNPWIF